jgi:hypothetical protein
MGESSIGTANCVMLLKFLNLINSVLILFLNEEAVEKV